MLNYVILILRYGFLIFLYLFILRVVVLILKDLNKSANHGLSRRIPEDVPKVQPTNWQFTPNPVAELLVLESHDEKFRRGDIIKIGPYIKIGRSEGNHIVINDAFTSNEHARLTMQRGQFWLEDLGSTNGTYVNGKIVEKPITLINGDKIKIGGAVFQFVRCAYEMH